jgi:Flp pilus assembly protein CpaB
VFAIALAIVAGLIFAWLFKMVLLDKKPPARPVDTSVPVTVAANNIYDKTEIHPVNVKTIRVQPNDPRYLAWTRSGKRMLTGNQPVGRVTKVPIMAEDPFFDDDLLPFAYPESVRMRIRPGMRAVIVTVPAKEAMVQVDDYVDVYATLSNDALGAGGNGTAEIAAGARVVARFGTTRPGAQPRNLDAPREYTLEVTPYRYALIELAKTVGAKFSLAVAPQATASEEGAAETFPLRRNDPNDPREQAAERVNGADLAALFGLGGPAPAPPPSWSIEKYVGINRAGEAAYPGYVPPSRIPLSAGGGGTAPAGGADRRHPGGG